MGSGRARAHGHAKLNETLFECSAVNSRRQDYTGVKLCMNNSQHDVLDDAVLPC
jgi:hypothetical protein